jgi:hypothetical protein
MNFYTKDTIYITFLLFIVIKSSISIYYYVLMRLFSSDSEVCIILYKKSFYMKLLICYH